MSSIDKLRASAQRKVRKEIPATAPAVNQSSLVAQMGSIEGTKKPWVQKERPRPTEVTARKITWRRDLRASGRAPPQSLKHHADCHGKPPTRGPFPLTKVLRSNITNQAGAVKAWPTARRAMSLMTEAVYAEDG